MGTERTERVRLMEAVLFPRVMYGSPVWATMQNKHKLAHLADKANNAAALFTLGTFRSTPLTWHNDRTAVKDATVSISLHKS